MEFGFNTLESYFLVWHLVWAVQTCMGFSYYLLSPAQSSDFLAREHKLIKFRAQLPHGLRSYAWINLPRFSISQLYCLDSRTCTTSF
jgi:hypothetical protein